MITLGDLAESTSGFSGADLHSLLKRQAAELSVTARKLSQRKIWIMRLTGPFWEQPPGLYRITERSSALPYMKLAMH